MTAVEYDETDGTIVAFTREGEPELHHAIAALDLDHPERRWAAALAAFACMVERGEAKGPYSIGRACRYARASLLPTQSFALLAVDLSDGELAAHYGVPRDQAAAWRSSLGLLSN